MENIKVDIITLLYNLLPGFITAWIFYGLTAHPKKSPFERTIQALIFTAIIKLIVLPLSWSLIWFGSTVRALGSWNQDTSFFVSSIIAIILGFVFSNFANTGKLHEHFFPSICATNKTSFPSEWYSAFVREKRYIYLHLKGERRLFGWPTEWPDHPDEGHFTIQDPEWILKDNQRAKLLLTHKIVIPVSEVVMVEFEKFEDEQNYSADEWNRSIELLLNLQKNEEALDDSKEVEESKTKKSTDTKSSSSLKLNIESEEINNEQEPN